MIGKVKRTTVLVKKEILVILILTLLNLVFKSLFLASNSYWLDEASQVYLSSKGLSEIYQATLTGSNGPIYTMLLSLWMKLFGYYEFSTRFLSVLMSSLTIPVFYIFIKKHWNSAIALGASLMFSLSGWQLYYAHEARSYTLITLLIVISFSLFFDLLKKRSFVKVVGYTLINTVLLYIHLIPVLALFVQGVITLFFMRKHFKNIWPIWLGLAGSLAFLSIWLVQNQWFGGNETVWMPKPNVRTLYNMFVAYFNSKWVLYLYVTMGGAMVFFLKKKELNRIDLGTALWGILPIIIVYMASIYYNPRFTHRYMLFATPGLYLSYVIFLNKIAGKRKVVYWGVLSISVLLMGASLNLKMKYNGNWRDAVNYIKKEKRKGDVVISVPYYTNLPLVFYYDIEQFKTSVGAYPSLKGNDVFFVNTLGIYQKPMVQNAERLILVTSSHTNVVDPKGEILKYAKGQFKLEDVKAFRSVHVHIFNLKHKPALYSIPLPILEEGAEGIGRVDPEKEYFTLLETKASYFINKGIQEFDVEAQFRYGLPNTGSGFIFSVEDLKSETFLQYHFFRLKKAGNAGHWNTFTRHIILEDKVSPDNIVKLLLRRGSKNDTAMVKEVRFNYYQ